MHGAKSNKSLFWQAKRKIFSVKCIRGTIKNEIEVRISLRKKGGNDSGTGDRTGNDAALRDGGFQGKGDQASTYQNRIYL